MQNLCKKIANVRCFKEIIDIAKQGNLDKVDLKIGDISKEEIPNLPKDITSSNFGKINVETQTPDIVLGIINMVFETIGVMAAFLTKNTDIKNIVVIGTSVSNNPYIKQILDKIEILHNIKFIIPENAEFICAIGAIETYKKCLTNQKLS